MIKRTIGLLALSVAVVGCSKAAPRGSTAPGYGGGDYSYDADGIADADDAAEMTAEEPAAEPMRASKERRAGLFGRRDKFKRKRAEAAPDGARATATTVASPAPPPAKPVDGVTGGGGGKAEPAIEKPDHDVSSRQIIYSAQMHVSVFNLEDSMEKLEALPEKYGGYIHQMSAGHMIARIPAKQLRTLMNELGDFGVVEARSLQALDVTAEYTDVESRIRVLEKTQTQMLELLAKARTVQEALEVRKALDGITMELEVLKGRMRQLTNQISYSTLTIQLSERGPHMPTPSSNDPFPWVDELGVESTEWR